MVGWIRVGKKIECLGLIESYSGSLLRNDPRFEFSI